MLAAAFAAYWIIQTREMRVTKAERRARDGELERDVVPAEAIVPVASAQATQ